MVSSKDVRSDDCTVTVYMSDHRDPSLRPCIINGMLASVAVEGDIQDRLQLVWRQGGIQRLGSEDCRRN